VVATYPGTVSPLRGLDPFGEAERDVWHGREAERDELAKLVTGDGFRAGLLFGEPGVGKTSLVRAGLIPYLRDHGIVALACEDVAQPAASFASGLSAFGIQPMANEQPVAFITRAVSAAVAGQQFVFIVDDADLACADETATAELSDLFARVVSRSAGRARFLFVCASERLHVLGTLERRTGSLFPPSTRYELRRIPAPEASKILDRILSFSGVAADPALADTVVQGLGHGEPMLTADLQLAGLAMRDLRITNAAALHKLGGPGELERAWLHDVCRATGNERSGLRLAAELAATPGPRSADQVIRRINLDPTYASHALGVLEQRGLIIRSDANGTTWMLRHELLATRVRELTAPARAAARRAFDLLGSKADNKERLTIGELRALRTEGIAPVTPAELAVVQRSKRYYLAILGGLAAVPIVLVIIVWISLAGRVYFDLTPRPGGETIVVRGGRAGLSGFFWLPGGWGEEVADTGLTRAMVAPEAWEKIDDHDLGAGKGDWDEQLSSIMAPQLAGLVEYATTGNEAPLEALRKAAQGSPDSLVELLTALVPIARGTAGEVAFVESALTAKSPPAVQRAAVAVAGAAAQRRSDVYSETLTQALLSPDPELRRIAFASVRSLGERGHALFESALDRNPDAQTRRELLVEVTTAGSKDDAPSAASAVSVLSDKDASPALKDRAKTQIRAALAQDAATAAVALAGLVGQDRAPVDARVFAIELLLDLDPLPEIDSITDAARGAFGSKSPAVRAAALPLYAKLDPVRAGGDLAEMLDDKKLDKALRVAAALGWGEVARKNLGAAQNALDRMLKDEDSEVRAAAATAAGRAGRSYQDKLTKMAKTESYVVRIGAARGLAASAEVGANTGVAIGGIAQLWREKGRPRREAAKVYAALARKKPQEVMGYLVAATRSPEDPLLHPIGVEGLCNAALANHPRASAEARRQLAAAAGNDAALVRRLVMSCVADGPEPAKNGVQVALRLVRDSDNEIRADAARVLALAAGKGNTVPAGIGEALVKLLDDPDRVVRLTAIRAVAGLGAEAPRTASTIMAKMFPAADEGEKLTLLRAARQIGAEEIIDIAIADASPIVRVEAVGAALAAGINAGPTLSAALADTDPQVRKAALERLAAQKEKLDAATLERTLALAVRDPNPELSQLALTTIARLSAKPDDVAARLRRALGSRAERERAQAAAAAIGLVDRDPRLTAQLLDPLLEDPSHDVRVAMLPALGTAYAKLNDSEKLAELLRDSEANAMRRIVVAAAFVMLARTENGKKAAEATLGQVADDGPPMARSIARTTAGLIAGGVDGLTFLQELVP
jgi:DNA-binding MarR family transcriptional regulator/HEAT repeat protein